MTSEPSDKSVTLWLAGLRQGDEEAARQLWERYYRRLVGLAKRGLGATPRRAADEEDVALSVFRRLCDAAERGGFEQLADRDDLWRLLVAITSNRVIDQRRRENNLKRGGGRVRGDSALGGGPNSTAPGFDGLIGSGPTPEVLLEIAEQHERLLAALDNDLRRVAIAKLESRNHEEIAEQLGITSRSVRRKLARIREIWLRELDT